MSDMRYPSHSRSTLETSIFEVHATRKCTWLLSLCWFLPPLGSLHSIIYNFVFWPLSFFLVLLLSLLGWLQYRHGWTTHHPGLSVPQPQLHDLSLFLPATHSYGYLPASVITPRSQLKASHSSTSISCLSSKSALGFLCLPLFLFSCCRHLAPQSLLHQSASSRPHSTPPLLHSVGTVLATATMGYLNATFLLPPTHLRFGTSITSCRKPSKTYPDWLCTLPFYTHSMLVISQQMLTTLSTQ